MNYSDLTKRYNTKLLTLVMFNRYALLVIEKKSSWKNCVHVLPYVSIHYLDSDTSDLAKLLGFSLKYT